MFCTNCGNELNENSDVCLKCGCLVNKKNTNTQTENEKLSNKSKVAGGLLGLFLGGLGVHNFYLGHKGKGTIQLILTIATIICCSVALLIIVSYIGDMPEEITSEQIEELIARYGTKLIGASLLYLLGWLIRICVGVWVFIESILIFCGKIKDKDGKNLR